jgi:hypothetical protein
VANRDFGPRYYAVNGRPMAMVEWARVFGNYRHIGDDILRIRGHVLRVSTVWLGLDHNWNPHGPPLIFETMVFENGTIFDDFMCRYSTLAQAQRGHILMVRAVKRNVRERIRLKQLIHNGHKPVGRPTKGKR